MRTTRPIEEPALTLFQVALHRETPMRSAATVLLALVLTSAPSAAADRPIRPDMVIHPSPAGAPASPRFEASVLVDGRWIRTFVNFDPARTRGGGASEQAGRSFSWTTFETTGPARVRVRRLAGPFESATLRPTRYGLVATRVSEDTVELTASPGQRISVEFAPDVEPSCFTGPPHGVPCVKHAMLVFADERRLASPLDGIDAENVFTVAPGQHQEILPIRGSGGLRAARSTLGDCDGRRVVVFPPGVHDIGYWQVPNSIEHIHIEGGALVYGAIDVIPEGREPFHDTATLRHVYRDDWSGETLRSSFRITGSGVLSGAKLPWRLRKDFRNADGDAWWAHVKLVQLAVQRVDVRDLTIAASPHWMLSFMNDADRRTHGTFEGLELVGAWCYNNDGLPIPSGPGSRISGCFIHANDDAFKIYGSGGVIEDCVVWQGSNGAVFQLGWFPKTVRNVTVRRVDVIHFENWYGVDQVNRALFNYADSAGSGTIEEIRFRDIRVEGPILRLFGLRCAGGQIIRNVTFDGLQVPGGMGVGNLGPPGANYFRGRITDFTFHDFVLGDTQVLAADQAMFEFTEGAGDGFTFSVTGPRDDDAGPDRRTIR